LVARKSRESVDNNMKELCFPWLSDAPPIIVQLYHTICLIRIRRLSCKEKIEDDLPPLHIHPTQACGALSKRSLKEEQPHGIYSLQYVKGMMLICLRCQYAVLQETGCQLRLTDQQGQIDRLHPSACTPNCLIYTTCVSCLELEANTARSSQRTWNDQSRPACDIERCIIPPKLSASTQFVWIETAVIGLRYAHFDLLFIRRNFVNVASFEVCEKSKTSIYILVDERA